METKPEAKSKSKQVVKKTMSTDDADVISFYESNPNLDFTTMNKILIQILGNLSTNLTATLTNTVNHQILSMLTDISKDISSIKQDIFAQLHDTKKEYIDNVKLIMDNVSMTTNERMQQQIQHILNKNNEEIILKTAAIIHDVIPKHNDKMVSILDTTLKSLKDEINRDTVKLMENINKDDKYLGEFISTIDTRFSHMITNLQQPIFSLIQSSDDRTNNNIQQIRDKVTIQQLSQESLYVDIHDFLNKYKHNSSSKGIASEHELRCILEEIFSNDEIISCGNLTATCDYRVNRKDKTKPTILFENKNYSRPVITDEVNKFERDLQQQQQHGIFLSQTSNITFKDAFQVDIINNLIHVYVPKVNYSMEKIKIAVEIVDALSIQLSQIKETKHTETTINIDSNDLTEFIELYTEFNNQKTSIIDHVKSSSKQTIDKIDKLQLSSMERFLIKNGFLQSDSRLKCPFCPYIGKNKAGTAAHASKCKLKPAATTSTVSFENIVLSVDDV